jgi:hypothetical protein
MEFFLGLLIGSLVVPFLFWLFKPDWLRKLFGLEPKDPYLMVNRDPDKDPITAPIVEALGGMTGPKQPTMVIRYMIPEYRGKGFEIVLTKDGRECVFTGKVSDGSIQETVLMARKN